MTARINPYARYELTKPLIDYGMAVQAMGLEPAIIDFVKIRASQLNGCAQCLAMHTTEARKRGETEMRIFLLDAWREAPCYSARERAAIAWTEALTRIDPRAEAEAFDLVRTEFAPDEQVALNLLIGVINSFNRLGVGFRIVPAVAQGERAAA